MPRRPTLRRDPPRRVKILTGVVCSQERERGSRQPTQCRLVASSRVEPSPEECKGQDQLFKLAVEAFAIDARRSLSGYWELRVRARRYGESWSGSRNELYANLSTDELVDVVAVEVATGLLESRW
jgi:hypothetical protein